MKKWLRVIGLAAMLSAPAFGSVNIDSTTFPDAAFRSYVSTNFDKDADGVLDDSELGYAKRIDISGQGTMSLQGIDALTALDELICDYPFDDGGSSFNFTTFKAAYSLNCEVDDSYFLVIYIEDNGKDGMTTPFILDIVDRSSGDYVMRFPLYGTQTAEGISFRTRGGKVMEVRVYP